MWRSRNSGGGGGGKGSGGCWGSMRLTTQCWMEKWRRKVGRLGTESTADLLLSLDARWWQEVKKISRWKAPGPDKIHGFWHKAFLRTNSLLKGMIWAVMDCEEVMPDRMVRA